MNIHTSTQIAPRAEIGQLAGIRDRAIKLYAQLEADKQHLNELVAQTNDKSYMRPHMQLVMDHTYRTESSAEAFRKKLDAGLWDRLMTQTEMRDLMGAKTREEWLKQLETDPPEFTIETATATFADLRERAGEIFLEGLVNVFENLPRDFRSHDGFKLGSRCVMTAAYSPSGRSWSYWSSAREPRAKVADLDRVFHRLAGIEHTHHAVDIAAAAMRDRKTECETRFFKLRWFGNGNIHVWFLDKETTKKANLLLAQHYGPRLGRMHLHPDER